MINFTIAQQTIKNHINPMRHENHISKQIQGKFKPRSSFELWFIWL